VVRFRAESEIPLITVAPCKVEFSGAYMTIRSYRGFLPSRTLSPLKNPQQGPPLLRNFMKNLLSLSASAAHFLPGARSPDFPRTRVR
jgi:hypothetical protein